jgi:hypothetical protein
MLIKLRVENLLAEVENALIIWLNKFILTYGWLEKNIICRFSEASQGLSLKKY